VSERRWNPVLSEWVMTATHRQERTFLPPPEFCPLCPTRSGSPPTELERETFDIAVFDNRYPSLVVNPPPPAADGTALTPVERAIGACEVVVYAPQHDATLASMTPQRVRHLIEVWAHRTLVLGAREEVAYVFAFENKGEAVGVTLHHPHGQIYAYPDVPPIPAREMANGRLHRLTTGRCLWCDLADQELTDGRRVLIAGDTWIAGVPFSARWPYEVHLLPRRHIGWLHELDQTEVDELAVDLLRVLRAYDALFGFSLPYVMAIHQRPVDDGDHDPYHLHIELYPPNRTATKLKYLAGSEAGAGAFINDALPEETAAQLRAALPSALEPVT
jgi:UDPglucose--hexose-1-phosphate uridylyltransferase